MSMTAMIRPVCVALALTLTGCVIDAGYESSSDDWEGSGEAALDLKSGPCLGGPDEQSEDEPGETTGGELPMQAEGQRQDGSGPNDLFIALEPDPDPWTPGHEDDKP